MRNMVLICIKFVLLKLHTNNLYTLLQYYRIIFVGNFITAFLMIGKMFIKYGEHMSVKGVK